MFRLVASLSALVALAAGLSAQSVKVSVLDRGQADGIVVRTPSHEWIVIDGGTNAQQADLMRRWGVTTIAALVVSHRHFDHNGGVDELLDDFTVRRFIGRLGDCPGVAQDDSIRRRLTDRGVQSEDPAGQVFVVDGVTFTVLPNDPVDDACPDDENDDSVVVRMDCGDFSMLLPGDADEEERDWLVATHADLLDVDVVKAAHHGAVNGTSDGWLAAVTPERVAISAGVNATYEHPQADAVAEYVASVGDVAHVYCTNRHMTVTVYGYADGRVRIYRQNPIDEACTYDGTHY